MNKKLSIIIPTLNEEKNILPLMREIEKVMKKSKIIYEVIFVDDNSIDKTKTLAQSLVKKFPILVYSKQGKHGKAFSILEGFSHAKYDYICMIDADLQYPPSAIPQMLSKIGPDIDIVVADRGGRHVNIVRKSMSRVYGMIFTKLLHGLHFDVQSGLKVCKKEVLERITFNPTPWTFDLELLTKSRDAGYKITGFPITFSERRGGESKIKHVSAAVQMMMEAIKLRIFRKSMIPFSTKLVVNKGQGFHYKGREFIHHTDLHTKETAFFRTTLLQKSILTLLIAAVFAGLLASWHTTIIVIIAMLTILYTIDLFFYLFLVYQSFVKDPEVKISKKSLTLAKDTTWPLYTIFCPLYKEWNVVPQFIKAIQNLDYPKSKLQVLLLLEEDDTETIEKIKEFALPSYFEILVIPHANPKTKPKALNYGLKHTKGEFAVIYDAEDIPDPDQLKKCVLAFQKSDSQTICIQAKLNFYNPHQNILTKLFSAEYSLWFDLVLTGLQSINAPIPLGGTSNHFKTKDIRLLNGWDPFNVTEDADLGMRIAKRGFKTAIVNSYTMEEANSDWLNWFRQRSRWIKGYMQTYLVHTRSPKEFFRDWKNPRFLTFQIIIGGKILSMLINPIMWAMTIAYFVFEPFTGEIIRSFFPAPIFYMGAFSLIIGNFLYAYYYMLGAARRGHWQIVYIALLTPVYWLAMSAAALLAAWELVVNPHYWQKTKHGLHLAQNEDDSDGDRDMDTFIPLTGRDIVIAPAQ